MLIKLFYINCRLAPESPRWMLMHQKVKETRSLLKRMARCNGTQLPDNYTIKMPEITKVCTQILMNL